MKYLKPRNYFITKSMNWGIKSNKLNSGEKIKLESYWFVKKFITYYYYIFSKQSDLNEQVLYEISKKFNDYIDSLPRDESIRSNAEKYFFAKDIRNPSKIITWNNFVSNNKIFYDKKEEFEYKLLAKKLYFSYLMNSGGQSGLKKYILKDLIENGVSYENIAVRLYEYKGEDSEIKRKINELNLEKESIYDNSKSSISNHPKLKSLLTDIASFLRNNRQLFKIYGFFYESNIVKFENHSLTHIGQLLVNSNYIETALIFEHQKIKIISQPPTITIQDFFDKEIFIEINPYHKILKYMLRNNSINKEDYQYKISRNVSTFLDTNKLKNIIKSFNSKTDEKPEDFVKELAKYMYGINDKNIPELYMIESKNNVHIVHDTEKLKRYVKILAEYKNIKNNKIKKDIVHLKNIIFDKKEYSQLKEWYNFISLLDLELLLMIIVFVINDKYDKKHFKQLLPSLSSLIFEAFPTKFLEETFDNYIDGNSNNLYTNNFSLEDEVTLNNFEKISKNVSYNETIKISNNNYGINHKSRNHIQIIKNFYRNHSIKYCDCCGEETFIKENGEYYLEYHHLVPISNSGVDHILNIFGICPNCHRKFHFINKKERKSMYSLIDKNNIVNKSLYQRYNDLMKIDKQIMMLDYLLDEGGLTKEEHTRILLENI